MEPALSNWPRPPLAHALPAGSSLPFAVSVPKGAAAAGSSPAPPFSPALAFEGLTGEGSCLQTSISQGTPSSQRAVAGRRAPAPRGPGHGLQWCRLVSRGAGRC